jgi:hypothetical protein
MLFNFFLRYPCLQLNKLDYLKLRRQGLIHMYSKAMLYVLARALLTSIRLIQKVWQGQTVALFCPNVGD